MDKQLTPEQQSVVTARPRGLLVSAAAGSGKTKVLVERLFYYVEEDGMDLDRFLIITFTEAAAAELRGKIIKHLNERLREKPDDPHLQKQTLLVYRADIKTINGFCMGILRENCHLVKADAQNRVLRPDFRVVDGQEKEAICDYAMKKALDRFYEKMQKGDERTRLFETIGMLNSHDDANFAELVRTLHEKLQAQPFVMQWIEEEKNVWSNLPDVIEKTAWCQLALDEVCRKAESWRKRFADLMSELAQDEVLNAKYIPLFQNLSQQLHDIVLARENGWDAVRKQALNCGRMPALSKKENFCVSLKEKAQKLKKDCTKEFEKLFSDYFTMSAQEALADLEAIAPALVALLDLTADYTKLYQEEKRRRGVIDFSDQEHEVLALFYDQDHNPTPLARSLAERYREVMVDEYQDTNDAQNSLFDAITNYGETLFCVGDVKQSIYRFRLANPNIFLGRYNHYPHYAQGMTKEKAKICLSRNFRSRKEVLDAVNFVFENIFSVEMGELDYGEEERLYCGAEYPPSEACDTEFHLISAEKRSDEMPWSLAEYSAELTARRIEKLFSDGFCVSSGEGERPLVQEDIAILLRYKSSFPIYQRILASHGLHCTTGEPSGNFYLTPEISVLYTFLCAIDNPRDDVALISVLRSPLFAFSPDLLAQMRAQSQKGDFYDALCASDTEEARAFLSLLTGFREQAQILGVRQLLAHIYDECNVLGVFGSMENGEERRNHLLTLLMLAEDYEKTGRHGLFPFLLQLRYYYENSDAKSDVNTTGKVGGIRLMSIHKSKGLEFPVVFLPQLESEFSSHDPDKSERVVLHPLHGIGSVFVDNERRIYYHTVADLAIRNVQKREQRAEEIRLLYVAMTRAKEKLIMIYASRSAADKMDALLKETDLPVDPGTVERAKSMGEWVLLPLLHRVEASPLRALTETEEDASVCADDSRWSVWVHREIIPRATALDLCRKEEGISQKDTDLSLLDAVYPYEAETKLPAKITATQLKGRALDEEISQNAVLPPRLRTLKVPQFVSGDVPLSGAQRGTAIHTAMQYIDFFAPADESGVAAQIGVMREKKLLSEAQADAVDCRAVSAFLNSETANRLRRGKNVEREYRFSLLYKADRIFPQASDADELMLQGVVDCFWEEDGALVVLDFKTDRVTKQECAARAQYYRPQLDAYANALAEIMGMPVKEKLLYFFETGSAEKL